MPTALWAQDDVRIRLETDSIRRRGSVENNLDVFVIREDHASTTLHLAPSHPLVILEEIPLRMTINPAVAFRAAEFDTCLHQHCSQVKLAKLAPHRKAL